MRAIFYVLALFALAVTIPASAAPPPPWLGAAAAGGKLSSGSGTIGFRDSTGLLSTGDQQRLIADSGRWPFDAHVVVLDAPTLDALEAETHAAVDAPNVVAIGIAPQLHKVVVRFGTGTGVKVGDYDSISKAGNAHLRAHEPADGIEAILLRAAASREATAALSTSATPVVIEHGLSAGAWVGIATLFAAVAVFILWQVRRARREREEYQRHLDENAAETSELRSRNIEEQAWADKLSEEQKAADPVASSPSFQRGRRTAPVPRPRPSYVAPVPAARPASQQSTSVNVNVQAPAAPPVYQSSGGDFVEGMLVGELLSQRSEPRIIEREVVREREPEPSYSRSDDAGGSSSSWGSDSGGSSSYDDNSSSGDSGGSSSSYDSGGSSDFGSSDSGGGGFDSGGGSSDF